MDLLQMLMSSGGGQGAQTGMAPKGNFFDMLANNQQAPQVPQQEAIPAGGGVMANGQAPIQESESLFDMIMGAGSSGVGMEHGQAGLGAQAQQMPMNSLMDMIGAPQQSQRPGQGYSNPYINSLMGG